MARHQERGCTLCLHPEPTLKNMAGLCLCPGERLAARADDASRYAKSLHVLRMFKSSLLSVRQKCSGGLYFAVLVIVCADSNGISERPICQQCAFGNRHDECQWDPTPLTKTEKLEARVRELEELVELQWGTQSDSDTPGSRETTRNGKHRRIRIQVLGKPI